MAQLSPKVIAETMFRKDAEDERRLHGSQEFNPLFKVINSNVVKAVKESYIELLFESHRARLRPVLIDFTISMQRYRASALVAFEIFEYVNDYTRQYSRCYIEVRRLQQTIHIIRYSLMKVDLLSYMFEINNEMIACSFLMPEMYELWFLFLTRIYLA